MRTEINPRPDHSYAGADLCAREGVEHLGHSRPVTFRPYSESLSLAPRDVWMQSMAGPGRPCAAPPVTFQRDITALEVTTSMRSAAQAFLQTQHSFGAVF